MSEDISKPVRLRRDDAHRTGPLKHHRGTNSKRPPEANGGEGMNDRKWYAESSDILGMQHWREGSTRLVCTSGYEPLQILDIGRHREGHHERMNCWSADE